MMLRGRETIAEHSATRKTSVSGGKLNAARLVPIVIGNRRAQCCKEDFGELGGATHWDGQDFLPKGINHNKYKEYGWIWIDGNHFNSFTTAQQSLYGTIISGDYNKDCNFTLGHTDGTWGWTPTGNFFVKQRGNSPTTFNLRSIGVRGATLFWKAEVK